MKIRRRVYSNAQISAYHVASVYLNKISTHPHFCDRQCLGYVMTIENLLSRIGSFDIAKWYTPSIEKPQTPAFLRDMPSDDQLKLQQVVEKFINPDMESFDMREACKGCAKLLNEFNRKVLAKEEVEIEFNEIVEQFYKYLKVNYGTGEKNTSGKSSIICSSGIKIPGFRENSPEHKWQVHLEKVGDYDCLIIGENFPNPSTSWSRVFSVKIQHDGSNDGYKTHWFEVIENMFFKKDFDFETLRVFTKVCEDFLAEVSAETTV